MVLDELVTFQALVVLAVVMMKLVVMGEEVLGVVIRLVVVT